MSGLDHITAYHLAIELAKKAGFLLHHASQKSESCYYYHPARGKSYLLRLSTHRSSRAPIGFNDVVAENPLQGQEARYGDPSVFLDGAFRSMEMAYVPD